MVRLVTTLVAAAALATGAWADNSEDDDNVTSPTDEEVVTSPTDEEEGELPQIEFEGKRANFKIFPGGKKKGGSWIKLWFRKIKEVDVSGKTIQAHTIKSLADVEPEWMKEEVTLYGVNATQVTMTFLLPFTTSDCRRLNGGGDDNDRRLDSVGSFTVSTFIFNDDAVIPYGDELEVPVTKGQMKWNIESVNWPFCAETNKLMVELFVLVPSDEAGAKKKRRRAKALKAKAKGKARVGGKKRPKSKEFKADGGDDSNVAMDLPEIVLIDDVAKDAEVVLEGTGAVSKISITFPHFADKMVYDPAVSFEAEAEDAGGAMLTNGVDRASPFGLLLAVAMSGLLWALVQ